MTEYDFFDFHLTTSLTGKVTVIRASNPSNDVFSYRTLESACFTYGCTPEKTRSFVEPENGSSIFADLESLNLMLCTKNRESNVILSANVLLGLLHHEVTLLKWFSENRNMFYNMVEKTILNLNPAAIIEIINDLNPKIGQEKDVTADTANHVSKVFEKKATLFKHTSQYMIENGITYTDVLKDPSLISTIQRIS